MTRRRGYPMNDRQWAVIEQLVDVAPVMDLEHCESLLETAIAFLALSDHRRGTESDVLRQVSGLS